MTTRPMRQPSPAATATPGGEGLRRILIATMRTRVIPAFGYTPELDE